MRIISTLLLLALFSCATRPDFSHIGKLWHDSGGYGTAFPVAHAADGFYVLTCWHVTRGADTLSLDLDGTMYYGGLVTWTDEDADVALVGFRTDDRPDLYLLGSPPAAYTTGWVAGYPMGVEFIHVAPVVFQERANTIHGLTGPGGSGGPVFDSDGLVVGLVRKIRTPNVPTPWGKSSAMMGWIVQISLIDSVREKLLDL